MNREDFLRQLIENKYGNVKLFSERINVPYTTVRTILEKGVGNARVDNVIKICNGLNIKPEDLNKNIDFSTFISNTVSNMLKLDSTRQQKVLTYAEGQLKAQRDTVNNDKVSYINDKSEPKTNLRVEEEYEDVNVNLLTAAGLGTLNFDKENPVEQVSLHASEIPNEYDLVARVTGDSMHPFYRDGEIIFIKEQHFLTENMIGLVEINHETFLKKMYTEDGHLILESLNRDIKDNGELLYPKIYADELDDVHIIGKTL